MRRSLPLLLLTLAAAAACKSSPAVWRSSLNGPDNPVPTLAAASVYDFVVPEPEEVDMTGVDIGDAFKAFGNYAKDHPDEVIGGVADAMSENKAVATAAQAVAAAAPALHQKAVDFLKSQGFALEVDAARSEKLVGDGMGAGDYDYVAPGTAAHPFGDFPLFGPGSKSSVVERLKTSREREAYASVQASFLAEGNRIENGLTCNLRIQVLDRDENVIFEGKTSGAAGSGGAPGALIQQAFDSALDQMRQPEIVE